MLLAWMRRRPSRIALADRARDTGQWELAARHYASALRRNPKNTPIWVQYGHSLKEQGKLAEAEAAYRAAIARDPTNADTHVQLGHALKLQSRRAEAKTAYLQAFALDPSLPSAAMELNGFGWPQDQLPQLGNWRHSAAPERQDSSEPLADGHDERPGAINETDLAGANGAPRGAPAAFVSDSFWRLHDGVIYGRIWACRESAVALELHSDGTKFADIPVEPDSGEFRFRLPWALADDEPHRLEVIAADIGERLTGPNLSGSLVYRSAIALALDGLREGAIVGWARDVRRPGETLELELLDGDVVVARSATSEERGKTGRPPGIAGAREFLIYLPRQLFYGRRHNLRLRCRGQVIALDAEEGVPRLLTADLIDNVAGRYVGKVEHASCRAVAGWALDRMNPNVPPVLSIHVDGEVVGTVRARLDSRLRHFGHGFHRFLYRLPSTLMNGRTRRVVIRIAGTEIALPVADDIGEPPESIVSFPLYDLDVVRPAAWTPRCFRFREPSDRAAPRLPAGGGDPMPIVERSGDDPLVSVIVLKRSGSGPLEDFLSSWLRFPPALSYEMLIVDQGPVNAGAAAIERYEKRLPVRLLAGSADDSFSASNNRAAEQAKGKYLLFADGDLILTQDILAPMARHLAQDPDVGMVGVKLVEPVPDGRDRWTYMPRHLGIEFVPVVGQTGFIPEEIADEAGEYLAAVYDVPAVTATLCMCRKGDFAAVEGFDEKFFDGSADVDLCMRLRERLGRRIVCDSRLSAVHRRGAAREDRATPEEPAGSDRQAFCASHSRRLKRTILRSLIRGEAYWRRAPLRVTFVVTEASITTAAGDLFTAMELAECLRGEFGWEVMFAENEQADIFGTDVLVVMRHDYDLRRALNGNVGLVTVGWVRNRVDEWLQSENFDRYNLFFCSSEKARSEILKAAGRASVLLPIGTNPQRFRPEARRAELATDLVFTGHLWAGDTRDAVGLLDPERMPCDFAIYGRGWERSARVARHWRGALPYGDLPGVYASAKLVLDDSHPVTREWNSLNSRVFDALAAGTLVLTNCRGGARELFGDLLPTFDSAEELRVLIDYFIRHPEERESRAAALSRIVRERHSYAARAETFRDGLEQFVAGSLRFGIKIGIPDAAERDSWGDWHFALGLKRALEARGHFARIDLLPDWNLPVAAGDDVSLVLRGLSRYEPTPATANIAWLISHPEEVNAAELGRYDHVFVASEFYCRQLEPVLGPAVSPLLQCTDPELFFRDVDDALAVPQTIFVGNSRNQRRAVVADALTAGVEFAVFGDGWDGRLPASAWKERHIANARLRHYYSGAAVVLNDHWPDMARHGFVSNRIFDAGACGATIITDRTVGLDELFGDAVLVYEGADELAAKVSAAVADPHGRAARGVRLARLIAARHTFAHRADAIIAAASRILDPYADERSERAFAGSADAGSARSSCRT